MSREERRAYERMMKGQEKGPALPPAAKARAERNAARRAARAGGTAKSSTPATLFTARFWLRSALIAVATGFLGFSLQWPEMPFALYVGLAVAVVVLALQVGFRLLQRRAAGLGPSTGPPR
jgi:hypothetical protein